MSSWIKFRKASLNWISEGWKPVSGKEEDLCLIRSGEETQVEYQWQIIPIKIP